MLFIIKIEKKKLITNETIETFKPKTIDFTNKKNLLIFNTLPMLLLFSITKDVRNKNGKTIAISMSITKILITNLRFITPMIYLTKYSFILSNKFLLFIYASSKLHSSNTKSSEVSVNEISKNPILINLSSVVLLNK